MRAETKTLPNGWAETTLDQLGHLYCGQSPSVSEVNYDGVGVPYVTGPEQWDGSRVREDKWTAHPRRIAPEGSIFITVKGAGVGKMFPGIHAAIGRDVYAFKPHDEMDFGFVFYAIRHSIDALVANAQGDIPGLSKSHILDHAIALPGRTEQRRISLKIEELFGKIDEGERCLSAISPFADKALGLAVSLRHAILNSAFRGQLVAQDANEEPASELLKRIGIALDAHRSKKPKQIRNAA
jgi:type I restriction enzyme S subunit